MAKKHKVTGWIGCGTPPLRGRAGEYEVRYWIGPPGYTSPRRMVWNGFAWDQGPRSTGSGKRMVTHMTFGASSKDQWRGLAAPSEG